MSKPINLSHSARQKLETCPRMYQLHYLEKIRPAGVNSTLLFGTAVDQAAEEYLNTKNRQLCRDKFKELWYEQKDGDGNIITIHGSTEIEYSANDLDLELIPESHYDYVIKNSVFASLSDVIKDGTDRERVAGTYWLSMFNKGRLLLKGFMDWVDENVEEVLGTQVKIELEDGDGNKVPGLADFVIKLKGYDKPVLVDLKTSARYYPRNSVKESEQLGLYYFYLKQSQYPDMERAAYLVLNKQIKKNRVKTCLKCGTVTTGREKTCAVGTKKDRCNGEFSVDTTLEAVVQYIHDEIPEDFILATIDKFNIAVDKIKEGNFEPCWDKCDNYYGRRCPYFEYCRSGAMDGLKKKESPGSISTQEPG
jgi:hypothetical protein